MRKRSSKKRRGAHSSSWCVSRKTNRMIVVPVVQDAKEGVDVRRWQRGSVRVQEIAGDGRDPHRLERLPHLLHHLITEGRRRTMEAEDQKSTKFGLSGAAGGGAKKLSNYSTKKDLIEEGGRGGASSSRGAWLLLLRARPAARASGSSKRVPLIRPGCASRAARSASPLPPPRSTQ